MMTEHQIPARLFRCHLESATKTRDFSREMKCIKVMTALIHNIILNGYWYTDALDTYSNFASTSRDVCMCVMLKNTE